MEGTRKELVNDWVNKEKVFLYKLGFIFLTNEEQIEDMVFMTGNRIQEDFLRIDRDFEDKYIATFIENCLLKEMKGKSTTNEHSMLQGLFKLEANSRHCLYMKYVLHMCDGEIAQFLNIREEAVIGYVINGFETLINERYNHSVHISLHNLLNYHEGKLSFDQYKVMNETIAENDNYRDLLEKLIEIINQLEQLGRDLQPSQHFLEANKPLTEAQINKRKRKQRIFTTVASLIFVIGLVISSVGVTELGVKWKVWTAETVGFGENVFVTALDQDIEITITHVAADEVQTILFYEIRDLDDEYHYNLDFQEDAFDVLERNDPDKWSYYQFNFYSTPRTIARVMDEDRVSEGRLFLPPIKNDEDRITVRFHTLEQVKKGTDLWGQQDPSNRKQIQGEWELTVPIKKYEPLMIDINEKITVDAHEILLHSLEITPTGTYLEYKMEPTVDGERYYYPNLQISHLKANGRTYNPDFYLGMSRQNRNLNYGMHTHPFEAIYYDLPGEIEVMLDRIVTHHDDQFEITIDYDHLPMDFKFLDTTITISEVELGNPLVIVLHEEVDEDRGYDHFSIDINYNNNQPSSDAINYGWGMSSEGIYIDGDGNKYTEIEEIMKLENPYNIRYLTSQQKIEIYFHDDDVEVDESMLPEKFMIRNYSKSHMINESITISLDGE